MNKGCLYWDESSRGVKNGKQDKRGRWCAEKRIEGRLVRKRSRDIQQCIEFLNDCEEVDETKPQMMVTVPTFYDSRFMVNKEHVASMEQRKRFLCDIIKESEMTLRYFESRDFHEINHHIERVVIPRLNVYCTKTLSIRKDMRKAVLECVALLYTYLYADTPIFSYEFKLRKMLRYYKYHGNFGFYYKMPEPVHDAIDMLDVSGLEKKFVVRRNK